MSGWLFLLIIIAGNGLAMKFINPIKNNEMKYTDLKKGSKVRTKHERAIKSIDWEVINVHTEPAINGRYLTLHNGEHRDKVVHECTKMQILSI